MPEEDEDTVSVISFCARASAGADTEKTVVMSTHVSAEPPVPAAAAAAACRSARELRSQRMPVELKKLLPPQETLLTVVSVTDSSRALE
jgi:hypothetical protein